MSKLTLFGIEEKIKEHKADFTKGTKFYLQVIKLYSVVTENFFLIFD